MFSPEVLTVVEVANRLKVCRRTIYGEMNSGRLKTFKVGARRLVTERALTEYIHAREMEAQSLQPKR